MNKKTILIFKNEIIVAEKVRNQLTDLNYNILEIVDSFENAKKIIEEIKPDIILLGVKCEEKNNETKSFINFIGNLKIPIIFITAYSNADKLLKINNKKPINFILTPFRIKDLHHTIQDTLYKISLERKLQKTKSEIKKTMASKTNNFLESQHNSQNGIHFNDDSFHTSFDSIMKSVLTLMDTEYIENLMFNYSNQNLVVSDSVVLNDNFLESIISINEGFIEKIFQTKIENILENLYRLIPFENANVILFDDESTKIIYSYKGFSNNKNKINLSKLPIQQKLINEKKPFMIRNMEELSKWNHYDVYHKLKSYIGVPIIVKDKVIGSINLNNLYEKDLNDLSIHLLQAFANLITTAVQNIRLFAQMKNNNDFMISIVDSLPYPFYVVKISDNSVLIANKVAKNSNGLMGTLYYDIHDNCFLHWNNEEQSYIITKILRNKQPVIEVYIHQDEFGESRSIQIYAYPIIENDGSIEKVIFYNMDITEQEMMKKTLLKAEKLATTGILAASVAHEIKNPLQSILGCISLAEEAIEKDGDTEEYFQRARKGLNRINNIVGRMQNINQAKDSIRSFTNINEIVNEVCNLTEKHCKNNKVKIIWEKENESQMVWSISSQINQVFLNLILNAIEAMPDGGFIRIDVVKTSLPSGLRIDFIDNGVGISQNELLHIFEPFFTTKTLGSGLGLSNSNDIIKQHGGWIKAQSKLGEGSTFSVWLPIR